MQWSTSWQVLILAVRLSTSPLKSEYDFLFEGITSCVDYVHAFDPRTSSVAEQCSGSGVSRMICRWLYAMISVIGVPPWEMAMGRPVRSGSIIWESTPRRWYIVATRSPGETGRSVG